NATPPVAAPQPSAEAKRVDPKAFARASEHELTFAKGYAQRRAAQQAAQAADSKKGEAATKLAAESQFGRSAAAKPKPKVARHDPRLDTRYAREEGFWGDRHQALAYGDARPRRQPPPVFGLFNRLF